MIVLLIPVVVVFPKSGLYVKTPRADVAPKLIDEIYDVLTWVILDLLKILNPSASNSRLMCSVKWIRFETRRSVVNVYGRL